MPLRASPMIGHTNVWCDQSSSDSGPPPRLSLCPFVRDAEGCAGVVGQVFRDRTRQVPLCSLLNANITVVPPLDRTLAEASGAPYGRAGTNDVVDASVVLIARREHASVLTSDVGELRALDPNLKLERL